MMKLVNSVTGQVVVENLECATSLWARLVGLLGRTEIARGHGLLIARSGNSIHTFFMKFTIDLVFLNKKGVVKHMVSFVKPWRVVFAPVFGNTDCLELPAGAIHASGLKLGDSLRVEA